MAEETLAPRRKRKSLCLKKKEKKEHSIKHYKLEQKLMFTKKT